MDLGGWNFDPSMLSSLAWNDNNMEAASVNGDKGPKKGKTESKATSSTRSSPARLDSTNWVGNLSLLSNFGELDYDGGGCSQQSKSSDTDRDGGNTSQSHPSLDAETTHNQSNRLPRESMHETHTVSEQSVNSGIKDGGTSSVATGTSSATSNLSSGMGGPQLHPMAIQSSATCPPHSNSANNGTSLSNTQTNSYLHMSTGGMVAGQNHQAPSDMFGLQGIDSAALASLAAAFQSHSDSNHTNQHISNLAANFMLATQAKASDSNHAPSHSHQPQHRPVSSTLPSQSHTGSVASAPQLGRQHRQQPKNTASSSKPPPFYLFDAPIELRANFMQNQRKLGLPIQHDPNSYHYGETVKGFHPQNLMNQQQLHSLSGASQVNQVPDAPVQLIDARHGNIRASFSGRVKNEREQKRAQKITELIEQLRIDMEKGGCKVEMRSKFHTLSQCADYVKLLIKTTKDKEDALDKLKRDLQVKRRKIEEDKAAQESRSDPESVTSSLTSDTNSSLHHSRSHQHPSKKMKATTNDQRVNNQHQDNTTSYHNMSSVSTNEDSSGGGDRSGSGSGEPSAQGLSTDKTDATGVSDLTDSNQVSSSNNSGSGANSGKTESVSRNDLGEKGQQFQPSSSSISSDAAVASVRSIGDQHTEEHLHDHKDVVFNQHVKRQHRKRPPEEITSLEPIFGLDYEEVFTMSNVPQLIATTSGKIVTWNKCFLKLTGIRRSEIERMTIFSLVKPEMLSNFFEIVAHALKPSAATTSDANTETGATDTTSEPKSSSEEESSAGSKSTRTNYAAMTLPCVNFPAMRKRRENDSRPPPQLHVTVTLMSDDDPRKRCFHCVFSNCKGTRGTLGILTPDLLASLFAAPEPGHKKRKRNQERGDTKYTRSRHETKSDQDMTLEDKQKDEIKAIEGKEVTSEMETLTDQLEAYRVDME